MFSGAHGCLHFKRICCRSRIGNASSKLNSNLCRQIAFSAKMSGDDENSITNRTSFIRDKAVALLPFYSRSQSNPSFIDVADCSANLCMFFMLIWRHEHCKWISASVFAEQYFSGLSFLYFSWSRLLMEKEFQLQADSSELAINSLRRKWDCTKAHDVDSISVLAIRWQWHSGITHCAILPLLWAVFFILLRFIAVFQFNEWFLWQK